MLPMGFSGTTKSVIITKNFLLTQLCRFYDLDHFFDYFPDFISYILLDLQLFPTENPAFLEDVSEDDQSYQ